MAKTRYYKGIDDQETYIVCEDKDGYLVILPGGNSQSYDLIIPLTEIREAHQLKTQPFKVEEHDESCREKW